MISLLNWINGFLLHRQNPLGFGTWKHIKNMIKMNLDSGLRHTFKT